MTSFNVLRQPHNHCRGGLRRLTKKQRLVGFVMKPNVRPTSKNKTQPDKQQGGLNGQCSWRGRWVSMQSGSADEVGTQDVLQESSSSRKNLKGLYPISALHPYRNRSGWTAIDSGVPSSIQVPPTTATC